MRAAVRLAAVLASVLPAALATSCRAAEPAPAATPAAAAPAGGPLALARRDAPFVPEKRDRLRMVVIGDTGLPGPDVDAVREAVRRESKDVVLVTGDLVYPATPECPTGRPHGEAKALLDERLGAILRGLGAPTLLLLGNHDTNHEPRDPARAACLLDYAATEADLVFPETTYAVDFGVAALVALDTNDLDDPQAALATRAFDGHRGWKIAAGHHVLRAYHDKDGEDTVRPWLRAHGLAPDLWVNGHAHVLQLGVYDGIPAVTSGATALLRLRPSCPPDCGEGQIFGSSEPGYALLEMTATELSVTFKDVTGKVLHAWSKKRGAPAP